VTEKDLVKSKLVSLYYSNWH